MSKWVGLVRTALASAIAISVNAPTSVEASPSANAYCKATRKNTLKAMERFVERFPRSPEAKLAMRDIVTLSQGVSLLTNGPAGLCVKVSRKSKRTPATVY